MDEKQLRKWVKDAKANARVVYHRGICASTDGMHKSPSCIAAWELFKRGDVTLCQRRADNSGTFEYIAVRLRPNGDAAGSANV